MGCDIHAHIERRKHATSPNQSAPALNYWVDAGDAEIERDYELFALLAGVRNDMGITPIAKPKGLIDDWKETFSDSFKAYLKDWGADAHSISYLTLHELQNADLDQEYYNSHLVVEKDKDGKILGTAGFTTGPHYGEVGMQKIFSIWGRKNWDDLIEKLKIAKKPGMTDNDVRLVFFFDN